MKHDPFDVELDEEEQEISDALSDVLDRGEFNFEELAKQAREAATNYLNARRKDSEELLKKTK